MKERITLTATVNPRSAFDGWQSIAREMVKPLSPIESKTNPLACEFVFDYHPLQIEETIGQLRQEGFASTYYVRRRYTKKELAEAEYLFLPLGTQVDSRGNTYPESARLEEVCPHCGFREKSWQYEKLQIRNKEDGYRLSVVDYHAPVMSRALADALRDFNATGLDLTPVGGSEPAEWYGWNSSHALPPMQSPPTRFYEEDRYRTESCKRNHGLGHVYSEAFYSRHNFDARDFNNSYELVGDRLSGGRRYKIISQRVHQLLLELRKGRRWANEPVRFVD